MHCGYFEAGLCHSCELLAVNYPDQVAGKDLAARRTLSNWPNLHWLEACESKPQGFRNKAKLVVGGSVTEPTLGILGADGYGIDLQECALYEPGVAASFTHLAAFIERANVIPFSVPTGRGELKNILVTGAPSGELMVRFVLRSTESVVRIKKHLPWLLAELPQLRVVSVNLLPERKAVPEGSEEIILTTTEALTFTFGSIELHLRPQSFFQTNTPIAGELYSQAAAWVHDIEASSYQKTERLRLWDLYCGVGGFALHCAAPQREVFGVEISEQAISSAAASAAAAKLDVRFLAGDAYAAARSHTTPDVVIVNPPRRGISELAKWLDDSDIAHVIYSSCNAESLAKDLTKMPHFQPVQARVFDMFPQSNHFETMVLLERSPAR